MNDRQFNTFLIPEEDILFEQSPFSTYVLDHANDSLHSPKPTYTDEDFGYKPDPSVFSFRECINPAVFLDDDDNAEDLPAEPDHLVTSDPDTQNDREFVSSPSCRSDGDFKFSLDTTSDTELNDCSLENIPIDPGENRSRWSYDRYSDNYVAGIDFCFYRGRKLINNYPLISGIYYDFDLPSRLHYGTPCKLPQLQKAYTLMVAAYLHKIKQTIIPHSDQPNMPDTLMLVYTLLTEQLSEAMINITDRPIQKSLSLMTVIASAWTLTSQWHYATRLVKACMITSLAASIVHFLSELGVRWNLDFGKLTAQIGDLILSTPTDQANSEFYLKTGVQAICAITSVIAGACGVNVPKALNTLRSYTLATGSLHEFVLGIATNWFGYDPDGTQQLAKAVTAMEVSGNEYLATPLPSWTGQKYTEIKKWATEAANLVRTVNKSVSTNRLSAILTTVQNRLTEVLTVINASKVRPVPPGFFFHSKPGRGKTDFVTQWLIPRLNKGFKLDYQETNDSIYPLNMGKYCTQYLNHPWGFYDELGAESTTKGERQFGPEQLNLAMSSATCHLPGASLEQKQQVAKFSAIFTCSNYSPMAVPLGLDGPVREALLSRFTIFRVEDDKYDGNRTRCNQPHRKKDFSHLKFTLEPPPKSNIKERIVTPDEILNIVVDALKQANKRFLDSTKQIQSVPELDFGFQLTPVDDEPHLDNTHRTVYWLYGPPGIGKTTMIKTQFATSARAYGYDLVTDMTLSPKENVIYLLDDVVDPTTKEGQVAFSDFYNTIPRSSIIVVVSNYRKKTLFSFRDSYAVDFSLFPGFKRRTGYGTSRYAECHSSYVSTSEGDVPYDELVAHVMNDHFHTKIPLVMGPPPADTEFEFDLRIPRDVNLRDLPQIIRDNFTTLMKYQRHIQPIISLIEAHVNDTPPQLAKVFLDYIAVNQPNMKGRIRIGDSAYAFTPEALYIEQLPEVCYKPNDNNTFYIENGCMQYTVYVKDFHDIYMSRFKQRMNPDDPDYLYLINSEISSNSPLIRTILRDHPLNWTDSLTCFTRSTIKRGKTILETILQHPIIGVCFLVLATCLYVFSGSSKDSTKEEVCACGEREFDAYDPCPFFDQPNARKSKRVFKPTRTHFRKVKINGTTYCSGQMQDDNYDERLWHELTHATQLNPGASRHHLKLGGKGYDRYAVFDEVDMMWNIQDADVFNSLRRTDPIFDAVLENTVRIEQIDDIAGCYGVMLNATTGYSVNHFSYNIEQFSVIHKGETYRARIVKRLPKYEICFFKLEKPGPFKTILKYLPTVDVLRACEESIAIKLHGTNREFYHTPFTYQESVQPRFDNAIIKAWGAQMGVIPLINSINFRPGDCGTPLFAKNGDSYYLVGAHAVTRNAHNVGGYICLTREVWNEFLGDVPNCSVPSDLIHDDYPTTITQRFVDGRVIPTSTSVTHSLQMAQIAPNVDLTGLSQQDVARLYSTHGIEFDTTELREHCLVQKFSAEPFYDIRDQAKLSDNVLSRIDKIVSTQGKLAFEPVGWDTDAVSFWGEEVFIASKISSRIHSTRKTGSYKPPTDSAIQFFGSFNHTKKMDTKNPSVKIHDFPLTSKFLDEKVPALPVSEILANHKDKVPLDAAGNPQPILIRMKRLETNHFNEREFNRLLILANQIGRYYAKNIPYKGLHPLSVATAISGAYNAKPLVLDTSLGHILSTITNKSVKADVVDPQRCEITDSFVRDLTLKQYALAKEGKRLTIPCNANWKSETLAPHKAWKKRLFYSVPLPSVINLKRVLAPVQHLFASQGNMSPVQLNLHTTADFHGLAMRLLSKGNRCIALDASSFDHSVPAAVIVALSGIITPLYSKGKTGEHAQKIASLIKVLLCEVAFSPILYDHGIYTRQGGVPSGCFGTSIIDGLALLLMVFDAFDSIIGGNFDEFNNHVALFACGDDLNLSVSSTIIEKFNGITIAEYLGNKHGIKITPAQKDDKIVAYTPIEQTSFCSNEYMRHPQASAYFIPKLKTASIYSALNYTKEPAPLLLYQQYLQQRYNLAAHGEEIFSTFEEELQVYAIKHHIPHLVMSYEEVLQEIRCEIVSPNQTIYRQPQTFALQLPVKIPSMSYNNIRTIRNAFYDVLKTASSLDEVKDSQVAQDWRSLPEIITQATDFATISMPGNSETFNFFAATTSDAVIAFLCPTTRHLSVCSAWKSAPAITEEAEGALPRKIRYALIRAFHIICAEGRSDRDALGIVQYYFDTRQSQSIDMPPGHSFESLHLMDAPDHEREVRLLSRAPGTSCNMNGLEKVLSFPTKNGKATAKITVYSPEEARRQGYNSIGSSFVMKPKNKKDPKTSVNMNAGAPRPAGPTAGVGASAGHAPIADIPAMTATATAPLVSQAIVGSDDMDAPAIMSVQGGLVPEGLSLMSYADNILCPAFKDVMKDQIQISSSTAAGTILVDFDFNPWDSTYLQRNIQEWANLHELFNGELQFTIQVLSASVLIGGVIVAWIPPYLSKNFQTPGLGFTVTPEALTTVPHEIISLQDGGAVKIVLTPGNLKNCSVSRAEIEQGEGGYGRFIVATQTDISNAFQGANTPFPMVLYTKLGPTSMYSHPSWLLGRSTGNSGGTVPPVPAIPTAMYTEADTTFPLDTTSINDPSLTDSDGLSKTYLPAEISSTGVSGIFTFGGNHDFTDYPRGTNPDIYYNIGWGGHFGDTAQDYQTYCMNHPTIGNVYEVAGPKPGLPNPPDGYEGPGIYLDGTYNYGVDTLTIDGGKGLMYFSTPPETNDEKLSQYNYMFGYNGFTMQVPGRLSSQVEGEDVSEGKRLKEWTVATTRLAANIHVYRSPVYTTDGFQELPSKPFVFMDDNTDYCTFLVRNVDPIKFNEDLSDGSAGSLRLRPPNTRTSARLVGGIICVRGYNRGQNNDIAQAPAGYAALHFSDNILPIPAVNNLDTMHTVPFTTLTTNQLRATRAWLNTTGHSAYSWNLSDPQSADVGTVLCNQYGMYLYVSASSSTRNYFVIPSTIGFNWTNPQVYDEVWPSITSFNQDYLVTRMYTPSKSPSYKGFGRDNMHIEYEKGKSQVVQDACLETLKNKIDILFKRNPETRPNMMIAAAAIGGAAHAASGIMMSNKKMKNEQAIANIYANATKYGADKNFEASIAQGITSVANTYTSTKAQKQIATMNNATANAKMGIGASNSTGGAASVNTDNAPTTPSTPATTADDSDSDTDEFGETSSPAAPEDINEAVNSVAQAHPNPPPRGVKRQAAAAAAPTRPPRGIKTIAKGPAAGMKTIPIE